MAHTMAAISLRVARPEDAAALLAIYAPYVTDTAITFEYEVPPVQEFAGRIEKTLENYPYLIAEQDGILLGYAYAGRFKTRPAYDWAVEASIYLRQDACGNGLGRGLYSRLEKILQAQHITNMNACIVCPEQDDAFVTRNSALFHRHMGFSPVGTFHRCGCKFGRWYDVIWMEKMLGEHMVPPAPVIPFPRLEPDILRGMGIRW